MTSCAASASFALMSGTKHVFSRQLFASSAPFSHLVSYDGLGYVAGIIGQRRDTGALISNDVAEQAQAMFDNLETLFAEVDVAIEAVLRTTIYLTDYADFQVINNVYRERLRAPYPARTTVQVVALPLDARVQIDAIVAIPQHR